MTAMARASPTGVTSCRERSRDRNFNNVPDECEADCNSNGVPDDVDITHEDSEDCNTNGVPDECDLAGGTSTDVNSNGGAGRVR